MRNVGLNANMSEHYKFGHVVVLIDLIGNISKNNSIILVNGLGRQWRFWKYISLKVERF